MGMVRPLVFYSVSQYQYIISLHYHISRHDFALNINNADLYLSTAMYPHISHNCSLSLIFDSYFMVATFLHIVLRAEITLG